MPKKRSSASRGAVWEQQGAWKAVDVGQDVLLGSDEYGFMGLEELDPKEAGAFIASANQADAAAAGGASGGERQTLAEGPQQKAKQDRQRKRKQPEGGGADEVGLAAAGGAEGGESVAALKAKLAAPKAENRQLKKKQRRERREQRKAEAAAARQQKQAAKAAAKAGQAGGGAGAGSEGGSQQPAACVDIEAWKDYGLGPAVLGALSRLGFSAPTHVQAECLPAAIRDRRDIIGAAQTGSGKTLAFGLPILELLWRERQQQQKQGGASQRQQQQAADRRKRRPATAAAAGEEEGEQEAEASCSGSEDEEHQQEGGTAAQHSGPLRALILAPTRELALQVCDHLQPLARACGLWVVPIVGGISQQKQERLLSKAPEVVVATPGRLWDLMREGQPHLTDLGRLSFLVIDEADRMVQQGHYSELSSILEAIPTPKQRAEAAREEARLAREERRAGSKLLPKLPPGNKAKGVAASGMAGKQKQQQEQQEHPNEGEGDDAEPEAIGEGAQEEAERGTQQPAGGAGTSSDDEGIQEAAGQESEEEQQAEEGEGQQQQQQQQPPGKQPGKGQGQGSGRAKQDVSGLRLQTFVFSATLTLPADLRRRLRRGGGGASGSSTLESLMDKVPMGLKPKIVDLTSERRLADKVEEAYVTCSESERDECLYAILARHPGRTIVFVNAISSVRRLGAILKLLGLPAHPLHAGMQQRQRLKALDRFKADSNAILVATDVAARGLDIKDVRCVIHYQLPASVDVYVHRSGRTARAEAEGVAIALVTPKESARFLALLKAMGRQEPPQFPLDWSLLPRVHERVRLAVRLDELARKQSKAKAERSWRQQQAEELGILLSDEEPDSESEAVQAKRVGRRAKRDRSGGQRGPSEDATAEELRAQLAQLLAEPLQPSFSRKWFTGGQAAAVAARLLPSAQADGPGLAAGRKKQKHDPKHQQQQGQQQQEEAVGAPEMPAKQLGGGKAAEVGAAAATAAGEGAGVDAAAAAATVSTAVALAQRMAESRSRAAQEATQKAAKQRQRDKAVKQKQQRKAVDPRAAALQAALAKHAVGKQKQRKRGGLVVVPQAFGRDAAGPDALQTLRQKLAALS